MSKISKYNKKLIAIDCGKAKTKVMVGIPGSTEVTTDTFDSTYREPDNESAISEGRIQIEALGIDAIIGHKKGNRTSSANSKADEKQKAILYYAIARNVNDGDFIDLVITIPISEYFDNDSFEKHLTMFSTEDSKVTLRIDGVSKTITINSINLRPECAGIIKNRAELFKDKDIILFDIGGLNCNTIAVEDGVPNEDMRITLNKVGSLEIREDLKQELAANGIAVKETLLSDIMLKGYYDTADEEKKQKSAEVVQKVYNKAVQYIVDDLSGREWATMSDFDYIFIGGTSDLLRDNILKNPKFAGKTTVLSTDEARWATVQAALDWLRTQV